MGILSLKNTTPDRCIVGKIRHFTWSDPVPTAVPTVPEPRVWARTADFRFPAHPALEYIDEISPTGPTEAQLRSKPPIKPVSWGPAGPQERPATEP